MQSVVNGHQPAVNHQTAADNQKSATSNKTPEFDEVDSVTCLEWDASPWNFYWYLSSP